MKKLIYTVMLITLSLVLFGCEGSDVISNINVDELNDMLTEDYQFVDIRTRSEYQQFHIDEFSTNIDYYLFSKDRSMLDNLDKEKPVVLICRSGNRSSSATKIFKDLGFTKVYNVTGGVNVWDK